MTKPNPNRRRHLAGAAVLATALAAASPSHAMTTTWYALFEHAPDLLEMIDTLVTISTNDVPGLISADVEFSERAKRAKAFHPGHKFEMAPVISVDQLAQASQDAAGHDRILKDYAEFVQREREDLRLFQERRDEQKRIGDLYSKISKRLSDVEQQAPDWAERSSRIPFANMWLPAKFGNMALDAQQLNASISMLAEEYKRIVGEYDRDYIAISTAHGSHIAVLEAIQAVKPPSNRNDSAANAPAAKTGRTAGVATSSAPATANFQNQLRSTIGAATGGAQSRALQLRDDSARARVMAGPEPTPEMMRVSGPPAATQAPTQEPQWEGTMTLERPNGQ